MPRGVFSFYASYSDFCSAKAVNAMTRLIGSLFLALMLALTSQSMAVARGASAAVGQMVLCTGSGPLAIYVDAQGQPTEAPHICPDSALNVLFDLAELSCQSPRQPVAFSPSASARHSFDVVFHPYGPPSRAPPLSV